MPEESTPLIETDETQAAEPLPTSAEQQPAAEGADAGGLAETAGAPPEPASGSVGERSVDAPSVPADVSVADAVPADTASVPAGEAVSDPVAAEVPAVSTEEAVPG